MQKVWVLNRLRRAAKLIEIYGNIKDADGDKKRGFCAYGAILAAGKSRTIRRAAHEAFSAAVRMHTILYNDRSTITKRHVLNTFKRAEKFIFAGGKK